MFQVLSYVRSEHFKIYLNTEASINDNYLKRLICEQINTQYMGYNFEQQLENLKEEMKKREHVSILGYDYGPSASTAGTYTKEFLVLKVDKTKVEIRDIRKIVDDNNHEWGTLEVIKRKDREDELEKNEVELTVGSHNYNQNQRSSHSGRRSYF